VKRARILGIGVAVVTTAALTACVRVPDAGPVVEATLPGQAAPVQPPFNNPPPPTPGADPDEIVSGFLDAMTATPLRPDLAGEFLTKHGLSRWQPHRVLTYTGREPRGRGSEVILRLHGVHQIGAAGQWQGRGSPGASRIAFPMAREDDEWRIASAPDALIVPRDFYDANYESDASLYYFDPTGRILVPEPVHVPQGQQFASSLVRALLRAPRSGPSSVTRTFIPPGLSIGISVPVTGSLAEVNLEGPDPGPLDARVVKRILAQLSWTLRQDTAISAFTLTIAGHPVLDAAGASRFSVHVDESDPFDPADAKASSQFYALRKGLLVSGQVTRPGPVPGPFGTEASGIGPFAVNLDSTHVAGVGLDSLLVGPVLGDAQPTPVLTGPGLLRPAWDFADRLWEVQNGPNGATVAYLAHGRGRAHEVRVPGITHQDVRRFLVSRDGSRIVAVLRGPTTDRIVVSRLRYDADGKAASASHARPIPWKSRGANRIRDIGWTSPTTIAVLDRLSPAQSEVRILLVDGSTTPDQAPPRLVSGRVRALASSPSQTPYAVLPLGLTDISHDTAQLDPNDQVPTVGLRHVTYAG
jgi:hypothetical protein